MSNTGQELGDKNISAAEGNLLDLNGDGYMDVQVMYFAPNSLPDKIYINDGAAHCIDSGLALDEEVIVWRVVKSDGDVDHFGKSLGKGYTIQLNNDDGNYTAGWQLDDPQSTFGGILLWRRTALGYVTGLGLLFHGSTLFIALIAFLLLQPFVTSAPFAFIDVIVILVMALVCFIPF